MLYGNYFDDTIITIHHLLFGSCVYLDRADYVWVQYKTSITITLQEDDNLVEYGLLFLHHIRSIPSFASEFMSDGLGEYIHMLKVLAQKDYHWQLTERSQGAFQETPGWIYRLFSTNRPALYDLLKLKCIRLLALAYSRYKFSKWKFLYGLLIN